MNGKPTFSATDALADPADANWPASLFLDGHTHGHGEPLSPSLERIRAALLPVDALFPVAREESLHTPSAVLIPLIPAPGGWEILFIQRSMRVSAHRGQVAFPGGKRERSDFHHLATALRETQEEIGIKPKRIEVLGRLPPQSTTSSGFLIHPFMGVAMPPLLLSPDPAEVGGVFTVPLAYFLDHQAEEDEAALFQPALLQGLQYHFNGQIICGATARILHHFVQRLQRATP